MNIECDDRTLKKLIASPKHAQRKLGRVGAKRLLARVRDLMAFATLRDAEHMPGRLHSLVGDRAGQFSLDLDHPTRLLFVPDHDPLPELDSGGLDWSAVTRIRLTEIADTH